MKKVFLAIILAASSLVASAQTQPTFGIKGGVNFAKLHASANDFSGSLSTGNYTTFSAGVFADAPVGNNFSIQPGLFYTGKGGGANDGSNSAKIKLAYLQLPVNVVYNVPVTGGSFFFGAGPYAAYGLSAKSQVKVNGVTETVDGEFGKEGGLKRGDFGATGLVGFRFSNGLLLNANYDLGLSNISYESDSSVKTRVFGISLGYSF